MEWIPGAQTVSLKLLRIERLNAGLDHRPHLSQTDGLMQSRKGSALRPASCLRAVAAICCVGDFSLCRRIAGRFKLGQL